MDELQTPLISVERRARCGVICIDNPPRNVLCARVRADLFAALQTLQADRDVHAIVLCCAGRTFITGACTKEFTRPPLEPGYRTLFATIEQLDRPVIAAAHGLALGAGVELMLACHYRCAVGSAAIGLPEVTLGFIPGAGGTQRLPRLIGARQALRMILKARPVAASVARDMGLLDRVIEADLVSGALAFAEQLIECGADVRRTADLGVDRDGFDDDYIHQLLQETEGVATSPEVAECAVEAVQVAGTLPFEAGLDREAVLARRTLRDASL